VEVRSNLRRIAPACLSWALASLALAQPPDAPADPTIDPVVAPSPEDARSDPWLDRAHLWLFNSVWRSARAVDTTMT